MKKLFALVLGLLLFACCLAGCSPASSGQKNIEGTLEELIQKIYDNTGDSEAYPRGVQNITLTEDMGGGDPPGRTIDYYIGKTGIPFREGVASESAIGSTAYSLVLLRMEDNADIEKAKTDIKGSVKPNKWICVAVDPSNVVVDSLGNLVILIMSDNSKALHDAFLKLAE